MKPLFLLLSLVLLRTCNITAVDYAVKDVHIVSRTQGHIDNKPAIILTARNQGEAKVSNVTITIKIKRGQQDLETRVIRIEQMEPEAEITKSAILRLVKSHKDYDLLTFAVDYEN